MFLAFLCYSIFLHAIFIISLVPLFLGEQKDEKDDYIVIAIASKQIQERIQEKPKKTVTNKKEPVKKNYEKKPTIPQEQNPLISKKQEIIKPVEESQSEEVEEVKGRLLKEQSGPNKPIKPSKKDEVAKPAYGVNPSPKYPKVATRRGYEGEVHVRVFVHNNGKVGKIELEKSSGYSILDRSALRAVKKWTFIPARKNGNKISSWVTVPIKFQLDKK